MDTKKEIDQSEEDLSQLRTRFYSSMNYNEYVSVFDKPPIKPQFKPMKSTLEEDLNDFHLSTDDKNDDSSNLPEVRKPSQSVNIMIGKYSQQAGKSNNSQTKEDNKNQEQIEEMEEEDQFESEFSISANQQDQGYKNPIRNRSQTENQSSHIFSFLKDRSRKQSLAN